MTTRHTFLDEPPTDESLTARYADDLAEDGYVWNVTRLWGWLPGFQDGFGALRMRLVEGSTLSQREVAILNTAAAAARSDSYCSLAWGPRLAALSDADTAAQVIDETSAAGLSEREAALADWARRLVRDSNATTAHDVEQLRVAGLSDREIFEATAIAALRLAFSTINGALGAAPDVQLAEAAPPPIRAAVTYGRAPS